MGFAVGLVIGVFMGASFATGLMFLIKKIFFSEKDAQQSFKKLQSDVQKLYQHKEEENMKLKKFASEVDEKPIIKEKKEDYSLTETNLFQENEKN